MLDPPEATTVGEPGSLARRFWEAIAEDRPEIARDVAAQLQAPPVANLPAFSFNDGAVEDLAGESVEGGGGSRDRRFPTFLSLIDISRLFMGPR